LLEGKVKVSALNGKGINQKILNPGQQAQLNTTGEIRLVNNPDMEEVMAWKNETFFFQGQDIVSIMKSIERWYDVDVEYKGAVTNRKFYVDIKRSVSVSKVLEILKKTGWIDYRIEDKKIIVIPSE
jgi:transmembrane sensor